MSRFVVDPLHPCPSCGLVPPAIPRDDCPVRLRAEAVRAEGEAREDEAQQRAEAAIEAARRSAAEDARPGSPNPDSDLVAAARSAVAEASEAARAEVESVAARVMADEDGSAHQRNWLRLVAELPWNDPPIQLPLVRRLAFGSEVPELAPADVADVPLVRLSAAVERSLGDRVERAHAARTTALQLERTAIVEVEDALSRALDAPLTRPRIEVIPQ